MVASTDLLLQDLGLELEPFDIATIGEAPWAASPSPQPELETLQTLQRWYDLGFLGVSQPGERFPDGFETASTGELLAYWMGREDAAAGIPGQTLC